MHRKNNYTPEKDNETLFLVEIMMLCESMKCKHAYRRVPETKCFTSL